MCYLTQSGRVETSNELSKSEKLRYQLPWIKAFRSIRKGVSSCVPRRFCVTSLQKVIDNALKLASRDQYCGASSATTCARFSRAHVSLECTTSCVYLLIYSQSELQMAVKFVTHNFQLLLFQRIRADKWREEVLHVLFPRFSR